MQKKTFLHTPIIYTAVSKKDRFTSNYDKNDQRLILHISNILILPAEMFRFSDNLYSVNIREGRMSHRPPGRVIAYRG